MYYRLDGSVEKQLVEHENISRLKIGDKNVALIGTAHVSQESADLVKEVIDKEKRIQFVLLGDFVRTASNLSKNAIHGANGPC